ncbi:MAG: 50S ribosomal protein L4 [Nitrospirae bacterium]|nr:MAG: 50S ribosomal protein L4 [Nitrospirota bacterium]
MLQLELKDINNNSKGKIDLSDEIFASKASEALVHSAIVAYLANQRQGTHATKTRGMVSGGGKKPWKQKSTGRARSGSSRSPIWRGGGTIFGPQPRDYSIKLPQNAKRNALYKALSMKLSDNELVAIDALPVGAPKTKEIAKVIKTLGLSKKSILFVLPEKEDNFILSVGNIPGVSVTRVADLNAYDVASHDNLVITADAIAMLQRGEEAA